MTDKQLNKVQFWIFIGIVGAIIFAVLIGVGSCIIDNLPKTITYKDLVSEKNYSTLPEKVVVVIPIGSFDNPNEENMVEITDASGVSAVMTAVKNVEWEKRKSVPIGGGSRFSRIEIYYANDEKVVIRSWTDYDGEFYSVESGWEMLKAEVYRIIN